MSTPVVAKVVQVGAVVAIEGMLGRHVDPVGGKGHGLEKSTSCHPATVFPVNVAVVSSVSLLIQRLATWVPVLVLAL